MIRTDGSSSARAEREAELRAVTYLAPGLPLGLFEIVVTELACALGRGWTLQSEVQSSGPMHVHDDPFRTAAVDLGFLCSPSFLFLRSCAEPMIDLVPRGFVFADSRSAGRAQYFAELVVPASKGVRAFDELAGGVFGFNDSCSLSGYFAMQQHLCERRLDGFFSQQRCTGSHRASLDALRSGAIDCASIDSNVLARVFHEEPEWRAALHVLASFGPFPIQPIVVRRGKGLPTALELADLLDEVMLDSSVEAKLARHGVVGFAPLTETDFEAERCALARLGCLPPQDSHH